MSLCAWVVLRDSVMMQQRELLEQMAHAGAAEMRVTQAQGGEPSFTHLQKSLLARDADIRLTAIEASGRVLYDSQMDAEEMMDHWTRPEVLEALNGRVGFDQRFSVSLREEMLYCGVPVIVDDEVAGVFRVSRPVSSFRPLIRRLDLVVLRAGLLTAAVAGVLCFVFARRFTEPIEVMRRGAEQFGRGHLGRAIPAMPTVELGELAESLNRMAVQLDQRIGEITRQRNEREAILESMREGVLAVDRQERILTLNRVAEKMLGVSVGEARGKLVQEVLRNVELQRFLREAADTPDAVRDQPLQLHENLILELRSQPLLDGEGRLFGLLIVLADVTRLHRLENLRREFVANVSHELRTPITSIKGFAETLQDGGLEDAGRAAKMVDVIVRQSDRLGGVIEDLLALSRLERRGVAIERVECVVATLIGQAEEICALKAARLGVAVEIECPPELRAHVSPTLLTQAVTNLLDNAITHGSEGGHVSVCAADVNGELEIRVTDRGPGIAPEHLERLFERFYRVDKARSRDLGGTGLGLSIVKHVAQAHGGTVTVTSKVGEGSTFVLHLPLR
ncbi:MAG: two-component system, OmpR family, phosphate regulon sensor histidine kinase PhoR [Candidatus Sumerlaeota bacterium]|nr:two-component system, OmpR family, phosphate regulon sensor histidine kinase PhoR [Candidatus Sumerlaeota bacterium]